MARDLTTLGDALRAALARLSVGAELASFPVWAEWSTVVGATIAQHARPTRLRRGVLLVEVDGPEWMQELRFLKRDLVEKLNGHLGRVAIRDVFFVLTGDEPSPRERRR
jgi:predicted nucleic acid-binding Zn ribbon protein